MRGAISSRPLPLHCMTLSLSLEQLGCSVYFRGGGGQNKELERDKENK